jgi:hypothetical protein
LEFGLRFGLGFGLRARQRLFMPMMMREHT